MKKLAIAFVVILALSVPATYLVIPENIQIRDSIMIGCTKDGATRILKDTIKWQQWWPGKTINESTYTFRDITYNPNLESYNGFSVTMQHNNESINSTMIVFPYTKDSVKIYWQGSVNGGMNPLQRFLYYRSAKACTDNMHVILEQLKNYLQQTQNIYNLQIQKVRVKDTLLISTKQIFARAPSIKDIYSLVYKLKNAIAAQGSSETNFPMLNITVTDSTHYLVNVAIPVNKPVKEENGITIKRMVPGDILITNEIKGGPYSVKTAFKEVEKYIGDYQKMVPAIPFQSLITNRILEPDSAKWITRIYYPVAY